ncbi:hypothetical protein SLA2020_410660 [Shorea laevis]
MDLLEENRGGWLSNGFELLLVGEGEETSFWWDLRCKEGVLAHKFPRLYILPAGMNYKTKQMGAWMGDRWCWMLPWRRTLLSRELQAKEELEKVLESAKLLQGWKDKWVWKYGKDGGYSTSSKYSILASRLD